MTRFKLILLSVLSITALSVSPVAARGAGTGSARVAGRTWSHGHFHRPFYNVYFGSGFGYPYYGYPGYGYYPYGYGYHYAPRPVVYEGSRGEIDGSVVVQVQRRLARAEYYHGAIDGVIGNGTRRAIRSYERANGLRVDGEIDRQLLATMSLE